MEANQKGEKNMKNIKLNLTVPQEIVDMLEEMKAKNHLSKTAIVTIAVNEQYRKFKREEIESDKK